MQYPSCIDLLLTNNSYTFQQPAAVCSGLSDYELKTSFPKSNPRQIT